MAFLKPIGLVFASVVLVSNAQCTIDGTEYTYNNYSCAIFQFMEGVIGLPDTFGGSDDICDGSWIVEDPNICNVAKTEIDLNLYEKGLSGCPNWSIDLPEQLYYLGMDGNALNCSGVDLTHLPTYLDVFDFSDNQMTGTIVWPLDTTEIYEFNIDSNGFEGSVDLSAIIDTIYIENNEFTSIDFNSIRDTLYRLYGRFNQLTGFVDLTFITSESGIYYLFLNENNFNTVDYTPMAAGNYVKTYLDKTVQCDASVYCDINEISGNRTAVGCTGKDACAATCVCISAPITCPQCKKNCKDAYHFCWKQDKTAREVCEGFLDTCADSCDAIQCA